MKTPRLAKLGLSALAAVTLTTAAVLGSGGPIAEADPAPSYQIVATDTGFDAPDLIAPGIVSFTLRNDGTAPYHAMFVRLNDGVTMEEFQAAFANGPEAALPLVELAGGSSTIAPGSETWFALDLDEGNYVLLSMGGGEEGPSDIEKGLVRPFIVTGERLEVDEPVVDEVVLTRDFAFVLPPFSAGETTVKLVNTGAQSHELVLFKLNEGKTFDDIAAFMENGEGEPPFEDGGNIMPVNGGKSIWTSLDLTAGNYIALCFLPDVETGEPHFALGMMAEFSVE